VPLRTLTILLLNINNLQDNCIIVTLVVFINFLFFCSFCYSQEKKTITFRFFSSTQVRDTEQKKHTYTHTQKEKEKA
jgi:hypothetical protein